jgi:[acyl-carrier-protein] S-malonyltransferase
MEVQAMRDDIVALFPGQGSLSCGAGVPWRDSKHWSLVSEISDASNIDVAHLLLAASDEEVVRTDRAQIATFALSMIGFYELRDRGILPRYLLGHSLGEFSALVASGLLHLAEGARLIGIRGRAMAKAAEETVGTMIAVMGAEEGARNNLSGLDGVWVANINGTGQIVLSGTREGLDYVLANHKDLGWKRATPLPVGGAFHSPLMSSAQSELDAGLASVRWGHTNHVLIANVDGKAHTEASEWRELLSQQMTSPVEFLAATLALPASVTTTIELPPAGVLTGLTKRIREFEIQLAPTNLQEMSEVQL